MTTSSPSNDSPRQDTSDLPDGPLPTLDILDYEYSHPKRKDIPTPPAWTPEKIRELKENSEDAKPIEKNVGK